MLLEAVRTSLCSNGELGPKKQEHVASESVADQNTPPYATRSATKQYRTTPLRGAWQHAPYFHNGSAATLQDVVQLYNTKQALGLTSAQVSDLAQY